ncbi:tape measure protein [Lactobacillus sp. ESL0679]|uniref:tape measure protein n=1 Tax=Lactobacillus sp. ESL0679 TaxID=2983209 RepID=UPI0023F66454|nr:tape measure protein [Lactobacillus sp. ESL0679]MDF7683638.1 tape measure protein [Lactobacillus sp. ESL0679]
MGVIETTIKLNDAFSGTLRKLESGLNAGMSGFSKLKSSLGNSSFSGAEKQSNSLFKSMVGAQVVVGAISKGIGLVSNGVNGMIGELNEASVSWQTFEGNMLQIGRTPAQIASAKASMQDFAQKTIYSASDMSSTYSQLAAVGIKNTGKLVKGFGGLAAAAVDPQQAMKTLSQQATQMAAKPKIQWMDFKLMLEQTPAGMAAVAKTMGKSTKQLVADVQAGTVKTKDFLDAVAKTGTNANFSKMATEYKTVGQAMDGLKETLANKLQPQFQKLSKVGINAISQLTDKISSINFDSITNKALGAINSIKNTMSSLTKGFSSSGMFSGFNKTVQHFKKVFGLLEGKNPKKPLAMDGMMRKLAPPKLDLKSPLLKSGTMKLLVTPQVSTKGIDFKSLAQKIGGSINDLLAGFNQSNALESAKGMIDDITNSVNNLTSKTSKSGQNSFFEELGKLGGGAIAGAAKAIGTIASVIGKLDPGMITAIGTAFIIMKGGIKGLKFTAIVWGLNMLSKMNPTEIKLVAGALGALATAIGAFKVIKGFQKTIDSVKGAFDWFGNKKKVQAPKIEAPADNAVKPFEAFSNLAGGLLKFAGALLLVSAAVWVFAQASSSISKNGGLSTFIGMIATIGVLLGLVILLGPALGAVSVDFLLFGAALLIIGLAIVIASAGLALLGTQLPNIANYGLSAALSILALAGAIAVFGLTAIIGAVGIIALALGITVLGIAMVVGAVGATLFAASLMLLSVFVLIAALGVSMLGLGLLVVGPLSLIAAIGLMLMAAALVIIGGIAIIAGLGLMILAVGLIMVAPLSMIAAVGLLLLGVAAIVLGAGLMIVAAGLIAVGTGFIVVGAGILMMVSMFIMAGSMMVSAISSAMSGVVNSVRNGISNAVNAARGFANSLVSVGRDLIQGLVNGIQSMIGSAISAVSSVASKVVGAAKSLFRIGSPSKLFNQYGRWLDQGLIIGLNRDAGAAADASANMAQGVVDAASGMEISKFNGVNPGDLLANGFNRALDSIGDVVDAITGLDGSRANIGISGIGTLDSKTINSDTVGSDLIGSGSYVDSNSTADYSNSQVVTIAKGAIVVNGSDKPQQTADDIMTAIENRMVEIDNRRL